MFDFELSPSSSIKAYCGSHIYLWKWILAVVIRNHRTTEQTPSKTHVCAVTLWYRNIIMVIVGMGDTQLK